MNTDLRLGVGTFKKLNFHGTVYKCNVGVIYVLYFQILEHKNNVI